MRIGIAYPTFMGSFQKFYPELELIRDVSEVRNFNLVIFAGGSDISPRLYGEENRYSSTDEARDRVEKAIMSECYERKIFMFGSCRGHQLINALMGGKLAQDIQFDLGESHPSYHKLMWGSYPNGGEFFTDIFSSVNSMHHQAVIRTGSGLNTGAALGRIVEFTWNERIVTTQFHPEWMEGSEPFFYWLKMWATPKAQTEIPAPTIVKRTASKKTISASIPLYNIDGSYYAPNASPDYFPTPTRVEPTREAAETLNFGEGLLSAEEAERMTERLRVARNNVAEFVIRRNSEGSR
jgi:putative glutamine amidotransferase